jgi:hypothetical protein
MGEPSYSKTKPSGKFFFKSKKTTLGQRRQQLATACALLLPFFSEGKLRLSFDNLNAHSIIKGCPG